PPPATRTASRRPVRSSARDRARRGARRTRGVPWDSSLVRDAPAGFVARGQPLARPSHRGLDRRPAALGLLVLPARTHGRPLLRRYLSEPARKREILVLPFAHQAPASRLEAPPGGEGIGVRPGWKGGRRLDRDAVRGAGRDAELAARAQGGQHRVHALAQADDRVDRAGLDALGAPDAVGRDDACDGPGPFLAAFGVEWERLAPQGGGEPGYPPGSPGGTAVDRGAVQDDRFGVGPAARIAALGALGLGQERIDPLDLGIDACGHDRYCRAAAAPGPDRKSTRLNSSHVKISYAVFCLKKKI